MEKRSIYSLIGQKRQYVILLCVIFTYIVSLLLLLPYYRYQINPDGISYISIAQKYIRNDLKNAINGYWSPMLSWLLVPFLFIKVEPLLAGKLLGIFVGVAMLIAVYLLSFRFQIRDNIRTAILITSIPITLYFWIYYLVPDLLMTCFLFYYLYFITSPDYPDKKITGILCGLMGAAGYLAKNYFFLFFVIHFPIFNVMFFFNEKDKIKKNGIKWNFIYGLIIFLILSGFWIYAISNKYHRITIGTSGAYNHALISPELLKNNPGDPLHPIFSRGLFKPPDETAVSIWEDPTYIEVKNWNPLESKASFVFQLRLIWYNLVKVYNFLEQFSVLSVVIIITWILCFLRVRKCKTHWLLTILIFISGYLIIAVENRYLSPVNYLLLLMGGHILSLIFEDFKLRRSVKIISLSLFLLSFALFPVSELIKQANTGKEEYLTVQKLKQFNLKGKIASNTNWATSLYLAYHLNLQYFGQLKFDVSEDEQMQSLVENKVDNLIVWGMSPDGKIIFYIKKINQAI